MANAKRASMREGPLAALFRKTEERRGRQPARRAEASRAPQAAQRARAAAPSAPRRGARSPPRESALPHPALAPRRRRAGREARMPSPQERLRHAFSSEIPENVMEPARPRAR